MNESLLPKGERRFEPGDEHLLDLMDLEDAVLDLEDASFAIATSLSFLKLALTKLLPRIKAPNS